MQPRLTGTNSVYRPPRSNRHTNPTSTRNSKRSCAYVPRVLSFVFGLLSEAHTRAAKAAGVFLIGTATDVDEAVQLEAAGVDAITLQGFEGGGHRGIFNPTAADPAIPLFDLLRSALGKVRVPLIAAGGLMTREDIRAALSAGASAVQMGTAFLAVREAGTSAPYRRALAGTKRETRTTRAFSGRFARGIENRFMRELPADAIMPFPAQNAFTRDLRSASAREGRADFLSLWAGTGEGELFTGGTRELIEQLFRGD